eukprot:668666-Pelagomonas_calceolata.AAC.2
MKLLKKQKYKSPCTSSAITCQVPRPQHLIDADVAQGVKRPKKHMDITLHSIWGPGKDKGQLTPEVMTATGAAAVSIMVLK